MFLPTFFSTAKRLCLFMENCFVRVVRNFDGQQPGHLAVKPGEVLKVIQYLNNQWLDAEFHGITGLVPVSCTEKLDNARRSVSNVAMSNGTEAPKNNCNISTLGKEGSKLHSYAEALYEFQARDETELGFPSGALITLTRDVDDDWFEGLYNGKTGFFPKNYVDVKQSVPDSQLSATARARAIYPFVGESDSELTFKEGQLIFLRQRAGSQWMIGEVDGKAGLFPSSFVNIEVDLPSGNDVGVNAESVTTKKSVTAQKVQWSVGMKARALYHFTALYSEDLELNEGDKLTIVSLVDDVWLKAQLVNGGCGLCPLAYLEPVIDSESPGNQNLAETPPLSSTKAQFSQGVTKTAKMTSEEENTKSHSFHRDSLFTLDSSVSEDPSPVLKPVCAVSPVKRLDKDSVLLGAKPALKPKPILVVPQRTDASVKSKSKAVSLQATEPMKSCSMTKGGGAGSSSTISTVSASNHFGKQDRGALSRSKSLGNNKGSLLDDDILANTLSNNLPSPLLPLPPGAKVKSPLSDIITPKRRAPPPPSPKVNPETSSKAKSLPPKQTQDLGAFNLADIKARVVAPRLGMQMNSDTNKQQARAVPISHGEQSNVVDVSEDEGNIKRDPPAVPSSGAMIHTRSLRGMLSPPRSRRKPTVQSRPASVCYMGGESVSQDPKVLLAFKWI